MSSTPVLTFPARVPPPLALPEHRVSRALLLASARGFGYGESVRALCMQLRSFWFDGTPGRAAMAITSVDSGDGRSLLTAALAMAFAKAGSQTLVIDADLRMPAQHQLFDLPNRSGLTQLLTGQLDRVEFQSVPSAPRLSVLTAGSEQADPQDCFGGHRLARLMDELALNHDVILVDTPPAQLAAETPMIAQAARGALMLARTGRTRSSDLQGLARLLVQSSVQVLGTTLNDAR
jgi:protein-tyrosine kinase